MMNEVSPIKIIDFCLKNLDHTVLINAWGEKVVFYNPNGSLKRGIYVLTVKEKDGANDKSSHLDREAIFRVNIGIKKNTFTNMFGAIPKRPSAGKVIDMNFDFTEINKIIPHPVYGWMAWVCVLNPSELLFEQFKSLILESYNLAVEKYNLKYESEFR
ncbi:DUF6194 family protein [Schinkia azotoformans]|uniref:DUF6194 family protein n=2 Tax=Schinkia azotoformans TaxID=1454 RepID=UPI002DBB9F7E|nr:DUF6194 family protein [Schinkia azotoformans]MEC1720061.1 DUF6194 family protein [Schinkia azotoformans]